MVRRQIVRTLAMIAVFSAASLLGCGTSENETPAVVSWGTGGGIGGGSVGVGGAGGSSTGGGGQHTACPEALGAHRTAVGDICFVVRSLNAERVQVDLFPAGFGVAAVTTVLFEPDGTGLFKARLSATELAAVGLTDTVFYGLRVWGPNWPWDEAWAAGSSIGWISDVDEQGHRYNPNKLLLDPYARETSHDPSNASHGDWWPYTTGPQHRATDTAAFAPKGIVLPTEDVDTGPVPTRPFKDQILYEVHLRGLTKADPTVPEQLRGTYAGAAFKAPYLADLGVTAIELLPLHETQNEQNDLEPDSAAGDNYWGYASLSFFAPERRFAADRSAGGPTRELKQMVRAFHDVGIAVYVDVVFNHTAEGGAWDGAGQVAPLLSWRGLDNRGFYQLGSASHLYQDDNGVGPNLAATSPLARDLVIDALRYWHQELGVDGFRFDLAPILANSCVQGCFSFDPSDPQGILARAVAELPKAVLIAEPWGVGAGTYQIGNFPAGWAEWNGPYRDTIRRKQNRLGVVDVTPGWLANRLSGSWELFGDDGRKPYHSLNYVVSHDGFTHRDLYSCNDKLNDQPWPFGPSDGGTDDNISWDQGGSAEAQRHAARTGLALLMLSAGVPMITGGDERYRTQQCNNNSYNLDSVGTWLSWDDNGPLFHFARKLMRFRSAHPALRPAEFRSASDGDGNGLELVTWYRADGAVADATYLDDPSQHFIALRLDGEEAGDSVRSLFIAYNADVIGVTVQLPAVGSGQQWYLVSDTHPWLEGAGNFYEPGSESLLPSPQQSYLLGARSVLLLVEQP